MESSEAKFKKMTETPITKLLVSLAVPTILSMLITAVYNMADTFFVGKISTSATGAVGIAFSLMSTFQSVGFLLGAGAGTLISRLLGEQNRQYASKVASTAFFTSLAAGAFMTITGLIFLDPLIKILGGTPTIFPHAKDYVFYILLGAPFIVSSFVLNIVIRFQGNAFYSMFGLCFGGLLNIVLDPIFIFTLKMGTGGAALATVISQFVSFCILLYMCGKGGNIKMNLKDFTFKWSVHKEILRNGLPSFYRQSLASLAIMTLNLTARPYGDAAIAAMSIVGRALYLPFSVLLGFGQGFQPVYGFNYGAKKYDRVIEAYWISIKVGAIGLTLASIVGAIFAPEIIAIFRKGDPEVIAIGTTALRLNCIGFPLMAWIVINNMMFQSIGKAKEASILSLARQGLFFIPLLLILPSFSGILGIQLSQPISDILTFAIALPMGIKVLNELNALKNAQSDGKSDVI